MLRNNTKMLILKNPLTASRYVPAAKMSDKSVDSVKPQQPTNQPPPPQPETKNDFVNLTRRMYPPSKLERKVLVWTGRFKKEEDIPDTLPQETIEMARNKGRIKVANYMMLATVIASIVVVYSGKKAAARGESITKMNLEWHRQMNEKK